MAHEILPHPFIIGRYLVQKMKVKADTLTPDRSKWKEVLDKDQASVHRPNMMKCRAQFLQPPNPHY